jgi:solute carrier family 25, member 39/40
LPSFANLPPNLGISSCCKEVFWVSSNTPYCVVHYTSSVIPQTSSNIASPAALSAADCAAEEAQRRTFTSTFDGLRKIARNEGLPALWRGLSPTLLMAVPGNVIYFAGYDYLRHSPQSPMRRDGIPDGVLPLIAGSTARVFAAFTVSPLEMFRTRMQASHSHTGQNTGRGIIRSTADGVADLVRARGIRALWTGVNLTLWRDVPFSAIYWWGYEVGRNALVAARERGRPLDITEDQGSRKRSKSKSKWEAYDRERVRENTTTTLIDSFVAGAGSGAVAALVTTPFDVGKTRQQTVGHSPNGASTLPNAAGQALRPEERSMPRFLWHIFKTEGMPGLFRGWAARLMKIAPSTAIMISTYELSKKWAGRINDRKESSRL